MNLVTGESKKVQKIKMTTSSGFYWVWNNTSQGYSCGKDGYLSQVMGLVNQAQNDKSSADFFLLSGCSFKMMLILH